MGSASRTRHHSQRGFTLAEVLVSLIILSLIAVAIAGAFSIGFETVGTASGQAKLTGSNDVLALEQQIGADINRAVCLRVGPSVSPPSTAIPTGGCTATVNKTPTSSCNAAGSYVLCLGWYKLGSGACHTVTYSQVAGGYVTRSDNNSSTGLITTSRMSTGNYTMTPSWTATPTALGASGSTAAYNWTYKVTVAFNQLPNSVQSPISAAVNLTPFSFDPLSPAVAGGAVPC